MIQIDMEMPEECEQCPLCHQAFDGNETRLACYGLGVWCFEDDGRLDNCPLHEVTADPDSVSRPQIHCNECKHCYPPLKAVVDNEVKEVSALRCSVMFGFTEADGWCYKFERKSSDG